MKTRKIVRFTGGLGNQMFQYAFYLALSENFPDTAADLGAYETYSASFANGFELTRLFGLKPRETKGRITSPGRWQPGPAPKFLFSMIGKGTIPVLEERPGIIEKGLLTEGRDVYLQGFWQSEQYFHPVAQEIRRTFTRWPDADSKNLEIATGIMATESVSVHVRRGDYLSSPFAGICTIDYYNNARRMLEDRLGFEPSYYIFSDDPEWCRQNLSFPNQIFVDHNKGEYAFRDMQLMSLCKHQVIANSSFSWWAAWLNSNPRKIVLCPDRWVSMENISIDALIPHTWVRIPVNAEGMQNQERNITHV